MSFRDEWTQWHPDVELVTLRSTHRSLAKPVVDYLCEIERTDSYHRLVVLIPEVQPANPWQWVLHNQRGVILDRAIRHGTGNVVLCRLRFRLDQVVRPALPPAKGSRAPGSEWESRYLQLYAPAPSAARSSRFRRRP